MWEQIILGLIDLFGSAGVCGVVVVLLQRKWSKKDKRDGDIVRINNRIDALVDATKANTIDRFRHLAKNHIAAGYIHFEDKENMRDMYKAYKALGGNGHLDTAMEEVNNLKVI